MDIVDFIKARLDEEEAGLLSVLPLGSVIDMGGNVLPDTFGVERYSHHSEDGAVRSSHDAAATAFFLHHDPQRVRRQIEAFRDILEAHGSWPVIMTGPMEIETGMQDPDSITLKASQQVVVFAARQYADHIGQAPTTPMLRAIAYIWRDHPDFKKAWTP